MECKVCGAVLEEGKAKCSECGFPVMVVPDVGSADDRKKAEEKISQLAQSYLLKKLAKVGIALKVYTNELVEDQVRVAKEDYITLAQGESLGGHEIIWYPEKFARLEGNPELSVAVVNTRGETKSHTLKAENPNIMDFWQVGVLPEKGLKCRVVLGSGKTYVETEEISLL